MGMECKWKTEPLIYFIGIEVSFSYTHITFAVFLDSQYCRIFFSLSSVIEKQSIKIVFTFLLHFHYNCFLEFVHFHLLVDENY